MAYRTIYFELFLLATLSKAYFLNGLSSFQLPHLDSSVLLENNGTSDAGKRINVAPDHNVGKGSLGATWGSPKTVENPLTLNHHKRVKRATGTTMGDVLFDLTSTQDPATTASIGDVFDFTVTIDLPAVTEATDVKMEIYGFDPVTGVGGFAICNTRQDSKGEQVTAEDPTASSQYHTDFSAVREKSILDWTGVETSAEDSEDKNKITVKFDAMMIPLPEVITGTKFYVSAGIEYSNEAYVWIAQKELTASVTGETFNATVDINADTQIPTEMEKGGSYLIQVDAYVTAPLADLKFTATQPLGYTDVFHFGEITHESGSSFECSESKLWQGTSYPSLSGASHAKYEYNYPGLLNMNGNRDATDDANKITFFIPIYVLNSQYVVDDLEREITLALEVGDIRLWTALEKVKISGETTPGEGTASSIVASLVNTNSKVIQGDGALYKIEVVIDAESWANLDLVVKGGDDYPAKNVKVVTSDKVGYLPPVWLVREDKEDGSIEVNFGKVYNPSTSASTIVLEVAFNTDPSTAAADYTVTCTIGGDDVEMPDFTVEENAAATDVTVTVDEYGLDTQLSNKIYLGGQVALDMFIDVPSGSGSLDLSIDSIPDFENTAVSMRICKVTLYDVGANLPCIDSMEEKHADLNKTSNEREFNDIAKFPVGKTCPITRSDSDPKDNQFKAQIVYELPPSETVSAGTKLKISGGAVVGDPATQIFVSSADYTLENQLYAGAVLTSHADGNIIPFFTDYPFVTMMDRPSDTEPANAIGVKESFFIKYILKPQPLSTGKYLVTFKPGANFKVCKLVVTHVGKNFPCTQLPSSTPVGSETSIWGFSGTDFEKDTDVVLSFLSLTNWGRDELTTDLIADDDSVQIVVFYQYLEKLDPIPDPPVAAIEWKVDYGDAKVEGQTNIAVSGDDYSETEGEANVMELISTESLIGPNDKIHKMLPKLVRFKIKVPQGYHNSFILSVENKDFDDDEKQVDLCSLAIVSAGMNLPCVHAWDPLYTTVELHNSSDYMKVVEEETLYKKISIKVDSVCSTYYSHAPEDNMLLVEVAVRVKSYVATGETVTLKVIALDKDQAELFTPEELTFTVEDYDENILKDQITTLQPSDIEVTIPEENLYGSTLGIGEKMWLPFTIQIPPDVVTPMEISFLMPSKDGRPILHATDVKFAECKGKNVLCVEPHVDLRRNFDHTFTHTSNVSAFMSDDSVEINLGYVYNAGFTRKWGTNKPEDNQLAVKVEVQMADHELSANDAIFEAHFAVKMGEIIVTTSQKVNVSRTANDKLGRMQNERGNIMVDVNHTEATNPDAVFNAQEKIHFETIIWHGPESKAEGWPAKIRVIAPKYVKYVEGQNDFESNYTVQSVSTDTVTKTTGTEVSITDFEFTGGILFPDIISLNFSLTVDPDKERPVGSGDANTAIVIHPICKQSIFAEWPDSTDDYVSCGSLASESFVSTAPECFKEIPLQSCQITASTQMDIDSGPENAITTDKAWSPALRTGTAWAEYIVVDFVDIARINQIQVKTPTGGTRTFRAVTKVKVEASNSYPYWNYVTEKGLDVNALIHLDQALQTRYIKLTFTANYDTPDASPIGVNELKFLGCITTAATSVSCESESYTPNPRLNTIESNDATKYRHFAVDTTTTPVEKKIIYFCDLNPYRSGMFCYCSIRKWEGGSENVPVEANTWSELPRYIGYIVGFSPSRGRVYFKDGEGQAVLSSYNCKEVELVDGPIPDDVNDNKAMAVAGLAKTELTEVIWPTDDTIKADFDGIYESNKLLVKWRSCCEP